MASVISSIYNIGTGLLLKPTQGFLGHQHYLHYTLICHELVTRPFQKGYGLPSVNKNSPYTRFHPVTLYLRAKTPRTYA